MWPTRRKALFPTILSTINNHNAFIHMKKQQFRTLPLVCALAVPLFAGAADIVDFDKIEHWAGDGPNRAALLIRFDEEKDPHAYVWGFRWSDGDNPTGEDMLRAICASARDLVILTQYTGKFGSTLDGIGLGDADAMLANIYFDFDMARDYEWINFDYYNSNSWFGQSEPPGDNTPTIMQAAIDAAADSHVIQHPLDYHAYGYPAYDYDCWKLRADAPASLLWQAGWYEGYWSYWLGSDSSDDWAYSGSGYSGRILSDGAIDAWTYTVFEVPGVGGFGEGTPPPSDASLVVYRPGAQTSGAAAPVAGDAETLWYSLSGSCVASGDGAGLAPGIYVVRRAGKARKIIIR